MRRIDKPKHDIRTVFNTCVGSIQDEDLRNRLVRITVDIENAAAEYDAKASNAELFTISEHHGGNSSIVVGNVTKGELKSVYTVHMVGENKPARPIYEDLRPLGKPCPLCGDGATRTLDHYLPKTKYPLFSVLPTNLIPSCRDCNTGKLAATAIKAEDQPIHPYYDPAHFFSDQWLFAKVEPTKPATVNFFVAPPDSWDAISKERVAAHFKSYSLSDRFSIKVSNELAILHYELNYLSDEKSRREHLMQKAESCGRVHSNSWQTALHQALAESLWYCKEGFRLS